MLKKIITIATISFVPFIFAYAGCGACGGGHGHSHGDSEHSHSMNKADIVETAIAAGKFKTLAAALEAADLVGTLKSNGPFTVFAPTDKAFAALPEGTLEKLLKPENKDELIGILTYHVLPVKVMSQDVASGSVETVNGKSVAIEVSEKGVTIDGANVVKTDIKTSNGVIHIIDKVILP